MSAMMRDAAWDLWPSVVEILKDGQILAYQLSIDGKLFDIALAVGPDRPDRCPAVHPRVGESVVCALTPGHDCPHVAASLDFIEMQQFVITSMGTARTGRGETP